MHQSVSLLRMSFLSIVLLVLFGTFRSLHIRF